MFGLNSAVNGLRLAVAVLSALWLGAVPAYSQSAVTQTGVDAVDPITSTRQYTYAWMFEEGGSMRPRGGTSTGPGVELAEAASEGFEALQADGLSAKERDRRAILAMAGEYRTSFDFIETIGFTPGYTPPRPYQSWGTERVYVVTDEPDFVSLQHIIVMHFAEEDGSVSQPMVVKHWRHDWRYEDTTVHAFLGRNTWQREVAPPAAVAGTWTQTVFQVDDSPRYEARGRWTHEPGMSYWESDAMRRPLPRREFSVRDDYHALFGTHRITITAAGWVQEEDALKEVLDEDFNPVRSMPYLAREAGLSRYERIQNYDFAAGDEYWEATGSFWSNVRDYWSSVYASKSRFQLQSVVDGMPLFMSLFQMAEEQASSDQESSAALRALMARHVTAGS